MSLFHCPEHRCPGHKTENEALLAGLRHLSKEMEKVMSALDNLKAADQALKDEVVTFLADIAGKLGNPDADVQAVADDINAEVAALQAGDPGAVPVDTGVAPV